MEHDEMNLGSVHKEGSYLDQLADREKNLLPWLLEQNGIPPTPENLLHAAVLIGALRIFSEREAKYAGAWKEFGALNNIVRLATKAKRLANHYWRSNPQDLDVDLDDAYDCINYAVFVIRQGQSGEWYGPRSDR